jgi:uncharacterized protein (DUF2252 family)
VTATRSTRGRARAKRDAKASDRGHLTPEQRAARGKAARADTPRSSHGAWEPAGDRRDPVALLEEQAATRVPELVPIRYGRMAASPFAFFRGAAYVMASDLSSGPRTGLGVQLCGDAHLSNFGGFGSPERDLLFDLNDFDETLPGPWEWDVKRLAASIAVAGRERGFPRTQRHAMVREAVGQYRTAMHRFARSRALEVWYARLDASELAGEFRSQIEPRQAKRFDKTVAKAKAKDSTRAFEKLAHRVNGTAHIIADPPLLVPVEDLVPGAEAQELDDRMRSLIDSYRATLPGDRRRLLDGYRYVHSARKVVGVGSVGTRAWVVLMLGRDSDDPLFLQAKECQPSVLEPFVGKSEFETEGQRVVEGQRLMQAASDVFLGWLRTPGIDGETRDFYVRQLWDWKASADIGTMLPKGIAVYSKMCAWTLARAHARSGDAIAIASYLGSGGSFDKAIAAFAELYADQSERDHAALVAAIDDGRIAAERGL